MGENQSERCRKKGWTRTREKRTERKETKTDLLTRTRKERSTSLSHFCLPLSTKSFLPLLFLVVLVCLTLSCPLTLPCFLCVCVWEPVTWSVIRVSGTELSHIDRARPPPPQLSLWNTERESTWLGLRPSPAWAHCRRSFSLKGTGHNVTSHLEFTVSWRHLGFSIQADNGDLISCSRCTVSKAMRAQDQTRPTVFHSMSPSLHSASRKQD